MSNFKYTDNAATTHNTSFLLDANEVYVALAAEHAKDKYSEHGIEVRHMRNRADAIKQAAAAHQPINDTDITWITEMWHLAKSAKRI